MQEDSLPTELSKKPLFCGSVQFSSVAQLCPTLCDPMNCSTPGLPYCRRILYQLSHREDCMKLNRIYFKMLYVSQRLPSGLSGQESACRCRRLGFDPWVQKIPWRRKWQPTPVFLPGKSHGQGSLEGYSSWGHKEPDTTERLNNDNSFSHSSFTL